MDLQALRYFVTVAEELSFRKAAERQYVTTSSLSAGIKRLEAELGVRLFERSSRMVRLTPAGADLVAHAHNVLLAVERLRTAARAAAAREQLVIGTLFGFGAQFIEGAIERLRPLCPDLEFDIRAAGWDAPAGGLRTRSVDAAVLAGPSDLDDGLRRLPLASEARVAILPAQHPLASLPSVTLTEIDELGWVRVTNADDRWHRFWRLDEQRGGPPREVGRIVHQPPDLLLAVRNGHGICTTLASVQRFFAFEGLALVPVRDVPPVPIDLGYWPDHRPPRLDNFVAALELDAQGRGSG